MFRDTQLRVAHRELEAKQAEINALRNVLESSSSQRQRSTASQQATKDMIEQFDETDDVERRYKDIVSKSLQILKNISSKTALKEVRQLLDKIHEHSPRANRGNS